MVQAKCHNEGCEKDEWTLRKRLEDYARGPTCPDCGSTRVEVLHEGAGHQQPAQPNQPTAAPSQAPAPVESPSGNSGVAPVEWSGPQETAPAVQQEAAIEQGLAMGNPLFNLVRGGPAQKEEAKADLLSMAGSAAVSFAEQARQEAREGRDRAKGADQKRIGAVDNYPRCIECNGQLTNLPPMGQEFGCPHCGEILVYEPAE